MPKIKTKRQLQSVTRRKTPYTRRKRPLYKNPLKELEILKTLYKEVFDKMVEVKECSKEQCKLDKHLYAKKSLRKTPYFIPYLSLNKMSKDELIKQAQFVGGPLQAHECCEPPLWGQEYLERIHSTLKRKKK